MDFEKLKCVIEKSKCYMYLNVRRQKKKKSENTINDEKSVTNILTLTTDFSFSFQKNVPKIITRDTSGCMLILHTVWLMPNLSCFYYL